MRIYHRYGRLIRFMFQITHPRWKTTLRQNPAEPSVYVIHHQNMFGPIHTIGLIPGEARIWALHVFCQRKACFDQYYHYTFLQRYHWPKALSFVMAGLLSLLVPPILKSLEAIPVYHDSRSIHTMKISLAALAQNQSIAICPDSEYTSQSPVMGNMQDGFFLIDKLFFAREGKHLPFIPVFCSRKQKSIVLGEAVFFTGEEDYDIERPKIEDELICRMNAMGRECGDIPPEA